MNLRIVIYIMLIHFLADFALQTYEQALNKSKSNLFLFYHVGVYALVWLVAAPLVMEPGPAIAFTLITGISHFVVDWVTSRINSSFFSKQNYHDGLVGVGFDQLIHHIQLFITFKLLEG